MTQIASPDAINTLISAIRTQIDVITALSSGGIGVIIVTWGRLLGIFDDANLSSFRKPILLGIPLALLVASVIAGYFAIALTTGYLTEIARGANSLDGVFIQDSVKFYFEEYDTISHYTMRMQLCSSIIGIVGIAAWFAWNITKIERATK